MDKDEALKQALEALEPTYIELPKSMSIEDAIATIKEALEQPAQEPIVWECKTGGLKPLSQRLYDAQSDAIKRHYSRIATIQAAKDDEALMLLWDAHFADLKDMAAYSEWNAALDEAVARIGEIKGFGQATQDSFAVYIRGLKK